MKLHEFGANLIKSGLKYDLKAVTHKIDEICSKRSKTPILI